MTPPKDNGPWGLLLIAAVALYALITISGGTP